MRIEQLQFFLEVAETRSIRVAADNLYISQPAVSRDIRALENELGIELFTRTVEGTFLTDEGNFLYPAIKEIIKKVNELKLSAYQLVNQGTETPEKIAIHILSSSTMIDSFLLKAIGTLRESYPFVQPILINLKLENFSEYILLDEQDKIDLVVLIDIDNILTKMMVGTRWHREVLFHEDYVAIVHENHSIARKESITLNELLTYRLIIPQNGYPTEKLLANLVHSEEDVPVYFRSNNIGSIMPVLNNQEGVLLIMESLMRKDYSKYDFLRAIPIKGIKGTCFAFYDSLHPYEEIIKAFIYLLKLTHDSFEESEVVCG